MLTPIIITAAVCLALGYILGRRSLQPRLDAVLREHDLLCRAHFAVVSTRAESARLRDVVAEMESLAQ